MEIINVASCVSLSVESRLFTFNCNSRITSMTEILKARIFIPIFYLAILGLTASVSAMLSINYNECPSENYFPCNCQDSHQVWGAVVWAVLECTNIPVKEIHTAFKQTSKAIDLPRLVIALNGNDEDVIPADLTGETRIEEITINCPLTNPDYQLKVNGDAFRSTQNLTKTFIIENCNTSQLDFGFLMGFHDLTELIIRDSSNLHQSFQTLPPLNSLNSLELESPSCEMNQLTHLPTLTSGLKEFYLKGTPDSMNNSHTNNTDQAGLVERVLNWILLSSAGTLEKLTFNRMGLKSIPKEINLFKKIKKLDLDSNYISAIKEGSLILPQLESISMAFNGLITIEPAAIKGNFGGASVDLRYNKLARLESSVFLLILEQMKGSNEGAVYVEYNEFDCTVDQCHLSWIIRDNRDLLKYIDYARCYNGTDFKDLVPSEFNHC